MKFGGPSLPQSSRWVGFRSLVAVMIGLCSVALGQLIQFTPVAADTDDDQFVLQGIAQVTPPIPPAAAFPAGFLQVGTYAFSGFCDFAGSSDDPSSVATECSATSSGVYTNVVCGTGTASGVATITSTLETVTFSYTIVFEGGLGTLEVTSPTGGSGFVQIIPTNLTSGGCVTAPVVTFNVTAYVNVIG